MKPIAAILIIHFALVLDASGQTTDASQGGKSAPLQETAEEEAVTLAIDGLTRQLAAVGLNRSQIIHEKERLDAEIADLSASLESMEKEVETIMPKVRRRALAWRITALRNPLAATLPSSHNYRRFKWLMKKLAEKDYGLLSKYQELKRDIFSETAALEKQKLKLKRTIEELAKQEKKIEELRREKERELGRLKQLAETSSSAKKKVEEESLEQLSSLKGSLPLPARGASEYRCDDKSADSCSAIRIESEKAKEASAVAPGEVVYAGWFRGYGNVVIVNHGAGYHSLYAGMKQIVSQVGRSVKRGDIIGQIDKSGLYFEMRKDGVSLDLTEWLPAKPEKENNSPEKISK
ncbi:MAG: hypothetical protein Kow0090_21790 [Myxococcota bacterium]